MGMLPGLTAHLDIRGKWTFRRDGRDGLIETFPYHPRELAELECQSSGSPYYALTYPILGGRWYPDREVLLWLCDLLYKDPQLVSWAYYEAGRVWEE